MKKGKKLLKNEQYLREADLIFKDRDILPDKRLEELWNELNKQTSEQSLPKVRLVEKIMEGRIWKENFRKQKCLILATWAVAIVTAFVAVITNWNSILNVFKVNGTTRAEPLASQSEQVLPDIQGLAPLDPRGKIENSQDK